MLAFDLIHLNLPQPSSGGASLTRFILALNVALASVGGAQDLSWQAPVVTAKAIGEPISGEFTMISDAVLWPDGSIVVADLMRPTLTRLSSTGDTLWSVGRLGSGPGEFRVIRSVVRCRNGQIAVFDPVLRRLTFLAEQDGKVLHTRTEPAIEAGRLLWCENQSHFIVSARKPTAIQPRPQDGTVFVEVRTLVEYEGATVRAEGETEFYFTGTNFMDFPFGERAEAAAGGTTTYLCQTGAGTCQAYDVSAQQVHRFILRTPYKPVTDADWQHAKVTRESALSALPAPAKANLGRTFDAMPQQKVFGRFETLKADDRGRLWIRTYERYRQSTDLWLVLTATGKPIARVVTPARLEPLAWTGDELVGQTLDEDGVPVVRRYRVPIP